MLAYRCLDNMATISGIEHDVSTAGSMEDHVESTTASIEETTTELMDGDSGIALNEMGDIMHDEV